MESLQPGCSKFTGQEINREEKIQVTAIADSVGNTRTTVTWFGRFGSPSTWVRGLVDIFWKVVEALPGGSRLRLMCVKVVPSKVTFTSDVGRSKGDSCRSASSSQEPSYDMGVVGACSERDQSQDEVPDCIAGEKSTLAVAEDPVALTSDGRLTPEIVRLFDAKTPMYQIVNDLWKCGRFSSFDLPQQRKDLVMSIGMEMVRLYGSGDMLQNSASTQKAVSDLFIMLADEDDGTENATNDRLFLIVAVITAIKEMDPKALPMWRLYFCTFRPTEVKYRKYVSEIREAFRTPEDYERVQDILKARNATLQLQIDSSDATRRVAENAQATAQANRDAAQARADTAWNHKKEWIYTNCEVA